MTQQPATEYLIVRTDGSYVATVHQLINEYMADEKAKAAVVGFLRIVHVGDGEVEDVSIDEGDEGDDSREFEIFCDGEVTEYVLYTDASRRTVHTYTCYVRD